MFAELEVGEDVYEFGTRYGFVVLFGLLASLVKRDREDGRYL